MDSGCYLEMVVGHKADRRATFAMKLGRLPLMILLVGLVLPCEAADYRELNGEGIAALRSGEYPRAETLFKEALASYQPGADKYDNTIRSNLAVLYRKMGRADEAEAIEAQVAAAEGRSVASAGPTSEKDYINFARQHLNEIVGAKLQHPVSVALTSAHVMKRPSGDMAVNFNGSTGDRLVSVEVVVSRGLTGQLAIAGSSCEAFYGGVTGPSSFPGDKKRGRAKNDKENDDGEPDASILSQPSFGIKDSPTAMSSVPVPDMSPVGGGDSEYVMPPPPPVSG